MLISVVVLTYNRCQELRRCLDSLIRQSYKDKEIIVIDNGSNDGTAGVLKEYEIRVIRDGVKNKAYLRNLGLRQARGKIVAYIDDDAVAQPLWLDSIASTFAKSNTIGAAGGPALTVGKQEILSLYELSKSSLITRFGLDIFNKIVMGGKLWNVGVLGRGGAYSVGGSLPESAALPNSIPVDIIATCNAAVLKKAAQEINGFDENFIFNQEDGDLFLRIRNAGYQIIFNPKAAVTHYVSPRKSTRASDFLLGRDYGFFLLKHFHLKSFKRLDGFLANIVFLNGYLVYKALKGKSSEPLKEIAGFFCGMFQYLFSLNRSGSLILPFKKS